jgi:hypothetical protein
VFANRNEEDKIFPLTAQEIAEAQKTYDKFKNCFKFNVVMDKGLEVCLIDNIHGLCKEGRMIISKPLQRRTILWYHLYLQHPGQTCLEATMNVIMYWKIMRTKSGQ